VRINKYPDSLILTINSGKWYSQISGNGEPVFFEINSCIISYLEKNRIPIIVNGGRGEKKSFPLLSVIKDDGKQIDFRYNAQVNLIKNGIHAVFKVKGFTLIKEIKAYDNFLIENYNLIYDNRINISKFKYYFTITREIYDLISKNFDLICRIEINGQNIFHLKSLNSYFDTNQFCPIVFFEYLSYEKNLTITYNLL